MPEAQVVGSSDVVRFPCGQCGAEVAYDAEASLLKCGHCGGTQDVPPPAPTAAVVEHRLAEGLSLGAPRGLGSVVR